MTTPKTDIIQTAKFSDGCNTVKAELTGIQDFYFEIMNVSDNEKWLPKELYSMAKRTDGYKIKLSMTMAGTQLAGITGGYCFGYKTHTYGAYCHNVANGRVSY